MKWLKRIPVTGFKSTTLSVMSVFKPNIRLAWLHLSCYYRLTKRQALFNDGLHKYFVFNLIPLLLSAITNPFLRKYGQLSVTDGHICSVHLGSHLLW